MCSYLTTQIFFDFFFVREGERRPAQAQLAQLRAVRLLCVLCGARNLGRPPERAARYGRAECAQRRRKVRKEFGERLKAEA